MDNGTGHVTDIRRLENGAPGLPVPEGRAVGGLLAQANLEAINHWVAKHQAQPNARARMVEGMDAEAQAMRAALEGSDPTPLERVLVERVVVTYAALLALEGSEQGHALNNRENWQRAVDRLQRRHLEACKALATVQKMRLPSTPVFVGGQHVHL